MTERYIFYRRRKIEMAVTACIFLVFILAHKKTSIVAATKVELDRAAKCTFDKKKVNALSSSYKSLDVVNLETDLSI